MKPFFKPEQFEDIKPIEFNKYQVAERANALLEKRGVRVFAEMIDFKGNKGNSEYCNWATSEKSPQSTHQALLVCIEDLPKKECEHDGFEAEVTVNDVGVITSRTFKCKHCGVALKARWEVAND